MALTNPINFFKTTETDALTKKGLTVGATPVSTTSVTFVDKPDNKTKDKIAANGATGDGAIFIEGKKVIQGVSVAEKQMLWDQLDVKERNRYSAAYVSVNNNSFADFSCPKCNLIFTFNALYDGNGTAKVTKATVNDVEATKTPATGRYTANVDLPASTTGYQSVTAKFSFTNNNTGYNPVTCTVSKTISHQVSSVIISLDEGVTPSSISISGATNKVVGINGTRNFATTAGKDMWICTPTCDKYSTIKSGGFNVPFDAAIQVPVNGINYNCRRKSDTPTDKTGTISMVIS